MTAIHGKPQGNLTSGALDKSAQSSSSGSPNAAVTKGKADESRNQDTVTRRARTEDKAFRTIGETNRYDNVDRNRTEGQDEDRRRLSTTELLRGQSAIRI